MSSVKTCITAPEPIGASLDGQPCFVVAATHTNRGLEINITGCHMAALFVGRGLEFQNPSPALLAFIQRAEAELLPKKKRSVGELTREDLLGLIAQWENRPLHTNAHRALVDWAQENGIKLPEER